MSNTTIPPRTTSQVACAHCQLPVPVGLVEQGAALQFCCYGCRTVYSIIHQSGLSDYYRVRDAMGQGATPAAVAEGGYQAWDDETFQAKHCVTLPSGTRSVDLRLLGVHCAACVWLVERLPKCLPGVVTARLHFRHAVARITWDRARVSLSQIASTLNQLGYTPQLLEQGTADECRRQAERTQLARLGVAGACAGNNMLIALALYAGEFTGIEAGTELLLRWLSTAIGLVSIAGPGRVFFQSAWAALRTRQVTLDVPIALALGIGALAGATNTLLNVGDVYFDSLSVLVFLLLVARYFQQRQHHRASESIGLMQQMTPSSCRLVDGDRIMETTVDALTPGCLVEVRAGELVPADGRVVTGESRVNLTLLTGEARPEVVCPESRVFAGAQNVDATIRVRVEQLGDETRLGKILQLVDQAANQRPPYVQRADRMAGWFTMVVAVVAAATFSAWLYSAGLGSAIEHTVALLIVACPCALGMATPLAFAVAIAVAARESILIKNAAALEKLAGSGLLLLDKTGTLTEGQPAVEEWIGPNWLKGVVARVESHSPHPIAKSLVEAFGQEPAREAPRDVTHIVAHPGGMQAAVDGQEFWIGSPTFLRARGVEIAGLWKQKIDHLEGEGKTTLAVALSGQIVAIVALSDRIKPDAADALRRLRSRGWSPAIISGDAAPPVRQVAAELDIAPEWSAGTLSPEDKLDYVRRSSQDDATVVMVGDGVNDAAALAAADVGVAVAGGAEAALRAADVFIADRGLSGLVRLVELSRLTTRTVRRNLAIALAYNVLAISLAAAGFITPLVAAILMPISSATVLASAMHVTYARRD